MQYIQAHQIYIATLISRRPSCTMADRVQGPGRTPRSPVCQGPATVTGPRVFWDPRGMALLQKCACGGQAASESHGQDKRGEVQQRHVWPEEVLKRGGRTQSLRRHGGFQYIPVTGSPATCVKPAAAHVSIRGLARRSAGKRRIATTNEFSDWTKIAGHILV